LVVDGESGDLLDELQEVDCRVEERGLEISLEIDAILLSVDIVSIRRLGRRVADLRFNTLYPLGDIDQRYNMDGELSQNGSDDVEVEDVVLRPLFA
jgi:hypothetical protein